MFVRLAGTGYKPSTITWYELYGNRVVTSVICASDGLHATSILLSNLRLEY